MQKITIPSTLASAGGRDIMSDTSSPPRSPPATPRPRSPPPLTRQPATLSRAQELEPRLVRNVARVGGKIHITVNTPEGTDKVPLEDFIDGDEFTDELVCNMVNDWNSTAELHPDTKRCCLFCRRRARKSYTLCGVHWDTYFDAIYC